MEAIIKSIESNFPVEKFRSEYRGIYEPLVNEFARSVQKSIPEHLALSENGELVFKGPPKEGFDKFLEDSKTDLEREQLPTLSDVVRQVAEMPQWKAFF